MSLQPTPISPAPEETARVARAAFPKGNRYLEIRDVLGTIYTDEMFADLYPQRGQPAAAPWRLALVTVFQFVEGLSDRQAADAVRGRIDWKYALSLELTDAGFDASVLSEFRSRLVQQQASGRLLDVLVEQLNERGWIKARGKQRTDSTHVLGAVRLLNRLELVTETLRAALEDVATIAPEWLRSWVPQPWIERYGRRIEEGRLPKGETERQQYAEQVGADGALLLARMQQDDAPAVVRELAALGELGVVWQQQYVQQEGSEGRVRLRNKDDLPPNAERHDSPYDPQVRYSTKRDLHWIGYKVHLTETCEQEQVEVITHVETTYAPVADVEVLPAIHEALVAKGVPPGEHFVDTGYMDVQLLLAEQHTKGIRLVGPVRPDPRWQAQQQTGYAACQFHFDWQAKQATCPQGATSVHWTERTDRSGRAVVSVQFATKICRECPVRTQCTHAATMPRQVTVRPQAEYDALQQARLYQQTEAFRQEYKRRAGVEGTISQAVRAFGLRQARYVGLAKTHLQEIGTAVALDLCRWVDWHRQKPRAKTRKSRFAALALGA
jgi:transposase